MIYLMLHLVLVMIPEFGLVLLILNIAGTLANVVLQVFDILLSVDDLEFSGLLLLGLQFIFITTIDVMGPRWLKVLFSKNVRIVGTNSSNLESLNRLFRSSNPHVCIIEKFCYFKWSYFLMRVVFLNICCTLY